VYKRKLFRHLKKSMKNNRRSQWPVVRPTLAPVLFSLPLALLPVGSGLLHRRRIHRDRCVSPDVKPTRSAGPKQRNKGKVTPNTLQECKKEARNRRLARSAVRLLRRDQKIEGPRLALPPRIRCGHLRSAVRSVFPSDLTPVQELSIKTVVKLEKPCLYCQGQAVLRIQKFKEERFQQLPPVDLDHLGRFKRAAATSIRSGWNLHRTPYIPTGHATETFSRSEGGSWNEECFSGTCAVKHVYSSGKPRIVTLYSGYNSEVLSPLHDSLYWSLRREGWLLVGSPTDEEVGALNGDGPYVSVDYQSATDNIRVEYCRAMVEVLLEKGVGLTPEEERCLRVVCELRFTLDGEVATRGQPMGSLMSFPLLCVMNKAVVDLALADMALAGKATWEEFRAHRCLINGDDLLYREFNDSRDILAGILTHGSLAGFVVNEEKTMVSPDWAEVNSTAFYQGRKKKKTNVSVLEWSRDVTDPVGFLADSIVLPSTFTLHSSRWVTPIRNAWPKVQGAIPKAMFTSLVRNRKLRESLTHRPVGHRQTPNPFPVVTKPAGYDLTRGEEICYISERVARLKERGYRPGKPARCSTRSGEVCSIQCALRKEKPIVEDSILKVLADGWYKKIKEKLRLEDDAQPVVTAWAWGEESKADLLVGALQAFKQRKRLACAKLDAGASVPGVGSAESRDLRAWGDYVEL